MNYDNALQAVRDRVTDELKMQLVDLQQYTRRYSAIVHGIQKNEKESYHTLKTHVEDILDEVNSETIYNDVDKFHRIGRIENGYQDIVIRFKSHTAKENFYEKRKQIKRKGIKIRPSLAPERKKLLNEANKAIEDYTNIINPPDFVYADIHGNLKVKMKHRDLKNRLFFKFRSITDLNEVIMDAQNDDMNKFNDIYACKPAHIVPTCDQS